VWRESILFRDWLRADPVHRDGYLAEKRRLAAVTEHVDDYGDGKLGWIGAALADAEVWAAATGWTP
jgi:dephospho-CoA kinase